MRLDTKLIQLQLLELLFEGGRVIQWSEELRLPERMVEAVSGVRERSCLAYKAQQAHREYMRASVQGAQRCAHTHEAESTERRTFRTRAEPSRTEQSIAVQPSTACPHPPRNNSLPRCPQLDRRRRGALIDGSHRGGADGRTERANPTPLFDRGQVQCSDRPRQWRWWRVHARPSPCRRAIDAALPRWLRHH